MKVKDVQDILDRIYKVVLEDLLKDEKDQTEIIAKTLIYRSVVQEVVVGLIRIFQTAGFDVNDESEELFAELSLSAIIEIFKPENRSVLEYKPNS